MTRSGLFLTHLFVWAGVCLVLLAALRNFTRFEFRSGVMGVLAGWAANYLAAVIVLGAIAISGGCTRIPDPVPAAAAAPTVKESLIVEALAAPEPVAALPDPCGVSARSVLMIIEHEIGTVELYQRKYQGLVCPGGASGPTGGVGYDFGHRPSVVILSDWSEHSERARLAAASGVKGTPACRARVTDLRDIRIQYPYAREVFDQTSLVEYLRLTRRAFGTEHFCAAPADLRGALTDLVYNRGASMAGPSRLEMRVIRDTCLPQRDWGCVAQQLRVMVRVWKGSEIERNMTYRRNREADLAEASI